MVDCSHGNSQKQHARQLLVIDSLIQQIQNPTSTQISSAVMGVMIESNLVEGRQNIDPVKGKQGLVYGQSITDACIGWEDTEVALRRLADAVKVRRRNRQN